MRTSPQSRAEEISDIETLAQNEVIIRFTSRPTDQRSVFVGQAYSDWYLKGRSGLNPDQRVYATDPRAEDPDSPASIDLDDLLVEPSPKDDVDIMKPIPTVSEWSLLILSLLMSLMGAFYYRQRF